jgi:hypothetical protein
MRLLDRGQAKQKRGPVGEKGRRGIGVAADPLYEEPGGALAGVGGGNDVAHPVFFGDYTTASVRIPDRPLGWFFLGQKSYYFPPRYRKPRVLRTLTLGK